MGLMKGRLIIKLSQWTKQQKRRLWLRAVVEMKRRRWFEKHLGVRIDKTCSLNGSEEWIWEVRVKGWEKEMWKFCLHEQKRSGDVEWDENSVGKQIQGQETTHFYRDLFPFDSLYPWSSEICCFSPKQSVSFSFIFFSRSPHFDLFCVP